MIKESRWVKINKKDSIQQVTELRDGGIRYSVIKKKGGGDSLQEN